MDKTLNNLFDKYLYEGRFSEALLVGQNIFNQDSGNIEFSKICRYIAGISGIPSNICSNCKKLL